MTVRGCIVDCSDLAKADQGKPRNGYANACQLFQVPVIWEQLLRISNLTNAGQCWPMHWKKKLSSSHTPTHLPTRLRKVVKQLQQTKLRFPPAVRLAVVTFWSHVIQIRSGEVGVGANPRHCCCFKLVERSLLWIWSVPWKVEVLLLLLLRLW